MEETNHMAKDNETINVDAKGRWKPYQSEIPTLQWEIDTVKVFIDLNQF